MPITPQEMLQNFLGIRGGPATTVDNPFLNSEEASESLPPGAPQHMINAMSWMPNTNPSSVPQTNEMSRIFPGRMGNALSNAALGMSMIPTGMTIGENIKNVSGAMTNLPYARMEHQYQMLAPQMQAQEAASKIGLQRAQSQEALQRGQYFDMRNQYGLAEMQQRGMVAAQVAAQAREIAAKQEWGVGRLQEDHPEFGPHGMKAGELGGGYYTIDPQTMKRTFVPLGDTDVLSKMQGIPGHGPRPTELDSYIANYMAQYPRGVDKKTVDPNQLWSEAFGAYQQGKALPGITAKQTENTFNPSNAELAKTRMENERIGGEALYNKSRGELSKKLDPYDYAQAARAAGQKPGFQFNAQYDQQRKAQLDEIDKAYGEWTSMSPTNRGSFQGYLAQRRQQMQGGGSQGQVRDYTQVGKK